MYVQISFKEFFIFLFPDHVAAKVSHFGNLIPYIYSLDCIRSVCM